MNNIVTGVIGGTVGVGRTVVNEYVLTVAKIDNGYSVTIRRGTEEQVMELRGMTAAEIETVAQAVLNAVQAATSANTAADRADAIASALESIAFHVNDNMELEVTY
jgi:hypothetical protein